MSSVEDEVMRIRMQFEKMTSSPDEDQSQALDLLKQLAKLKVNLNILTTTKVGMAVNALRKSSKDDEVIALAKSLIKQWKKLVPESAEKKDKKREDAKGDKDDAKNGSNSSSGGGSSKNSSSSSSSAPLPDKTFPEKPQQTTDQVRLRCREMLTNALRGEGELPEGVYKPVDEIAELVEDAVFNKFRDTGMKYKNQIRSRVFNLKDKKNPALRESVLTGTIPPEQIAKMTAEEMASDDVRLNRWILLS